MRTRKSINTGAFVFRSSLARKEYTDAITGGITALTMLEAAEALGADARFAFAATPQTTIGTDTTYTVDYETLYLIRDHLGSVRAVTDNQGNILERNDYYPYGLQTDLGRNYPAIAEKYRVKLPASFSDYNHNNNGFPTLSSATEKLLPYRLLYNGKELQMMAQTRLVDYGARQYDPTIARWNAPDKKYEVSFYNLYVFCNSNPTRRIDLDGNEDIDIHELIDHNDVNLEVEQNIMPDDPPQYSITSQTTSVKTEKEIFKQNPFLSVKLGTIMKNGKSKVLNNDIRVTTTDKPEGIEISKSIEHQLNTPPLIGRIEIGLSNNSNSNTFVKALASVGISFGANMLVGITEAKNTLNSTLFVSISANNPNNNQTLFFTIGVKPIGILYGFATKGFSLPLYFSPELTFATP